MAALYTFSQKKFLLIIFVTAKSIADPAIDCLSSLKLRLGCIMNLLHCVSIPLAMNELCESYGIFSRGRPSQFYIKMMELRRIFFIIPRLRFYSHNSFS